MKYLSPVISDSLIFFSCVDLFDMPCTMAHPTIASKPNLHKIGLAKPVPNTIETDFISTMLGNVCLYRATKPQADGG